MPSIHVDKLCLHYPVLSSVRTRMSAQPSTDLIATNGQRQHIEALRNISFDVKSGQRLGLVGRNGSGKSTLLRVLGHIYEPTGGMVKIEGKTSPLFNINLGTKPEASGRQNIILRGLIKGVRRKKIMQKMDEIIAFSELEDFIDMPVRTYSSGMAMRLSFAIATSFRPEILLLDEWIGAGDAQFQKKASDRMTSLVQEAGITVIASHNRELVKKVCDLGLWLDGGAMRAFGPLDEVYKKMDDTNQK